ncbi:MAG: hypothetical protein KatS3mg061_1276 [Dehalococcoidia bacterium]|nr:MAG: hypothetical protein KatS3mg061_1276 [Dehalococcoidia bacterium]
MTMSPTSATSVAARRALAQDAVALYRPLLNFARSLLRTREALGQLPPGALRPEDVVDQALLEALGQAEPATAPRYPWLRRFVRQVLDREVARRQEERRRLRSLEQPLVTHQPEEGEGRPLRLLDLLPDPTSPIPEEVVASAEFQRQLAAILCQLPEAWREPFLLHVRDGLSLKQVAALEGVPVREVRRRIELARQFLREWLAEEYRDTPVPPPTETLFTVLERIEPSAAACERLRDRLAAAIETATGGSSA